MNGSLASKLYGNPCVLHIFELVAFLRLVDIARQGEAHSEPDFYAPLPAGIAAEPARGHGGQFNGTHDASGLKADFELARGVDFRAGRFRPSARMRSAAGQPASRCRSRSW